MAQREQRGRDCAGTARPPAGAAPGPVTQRARTTSRSTAAPDSAGRMPSEGRLFPANRLDQWPVESQAGDSGAPSRGCADKPCAIPAKVLLPALSAWIKERRVLA